MVCVTPAIPAIIIIILGDPKVAKQDFLRKEERGGYSSTIYDS
jgi:hypothetical protein